METQGTPNSSFERQTRRKPVPSYQAPLVNDGYPAEPANEPFLPDQDESLDANPTEPTRAKKERYWVGVTDEDAARSQGYSPVFQAQDAPTKQLDSDDGKSQRDWKSSARRILKGWWQEVLFCVLSIVSLVVLVVVLQAFDGKPLPAWPSGITINTVVAFLSTIARTAFVVPVAEGLSQCKWNWFKKKPRPLKDFEVFDQASRGLWGSLSLLFRTKGWLVGILSALLLMSAIATSTLTQSAVTYPSRDVQIEIEGNAVAWRVASYFWSSANMFNRINNMAPVARGAAQAIYTPPTEILSFREPECLASNCTWPQFSTLAACYKTNDLSHLVERNNTNLTLPNGLNMTIGSGFETAAISSGPSLSFNDTREQEASILNYFIMYQYTYGMKREPARAVEVLLHWCVNTYEPKVENNVLSMALKSSHTEVHHGDVEIENWSPNIINMTYLVSPDDEGARYGVGGSGPPQVTEIVDKAVSGHSVNQGLNLFDSGSDMLLHGWSETKRKYQILASQENRTVTTEEEEKAWWEAIDGMARNMGNGIANSLLDASLQSTTVNGTAWQREVYVQIRWPWIALLASQVFLSIVLLILVIVETAWADIDIIKSSNLAALFAISSKEKTGLERRFTEGESLMGKGNDHMLVPAGIAGELRRENGKWILGGSR